MKPIHLNLASRPYRDYRPVYAVVAAMALLSAFLLVNNVDTYYRYTHETRSTRAKIEQAVSMAAREREVAESAKHRLQSLDLTQLDQQTRYINQRLAERAFSWSTLLDELESVVAPDVRLISITPGFNAEGPVDLTLGFQSRSPNGMIETINRMHADPQFASPFPRDESVIEGGFAFNLTVQYVPPAKSRVLTGVRR